MTEVASYKYILGSAVVARPFAEAATNGLAAEGVVGLISPMVGSFSGCWARTASGAASTLQTKGAKAVPLLLSEGSRGAIIMKSQAAGKGEGKLGTA